MAQTSSNNTAYPRSANDPNNTGGSSYASPNHSRRTSSVMAPPPVPQNSSLPNSPRPPAATMEHSGYVGATGPIRHPRPLTAAELHLELEKEQESIVNRLTRELSALRAQTASVASTASSTSDLFTSNPLDPHIYHYQSGITPTSARRHRSSSNLSSRSARSARDALANSASVTSVSGVAAPRDRDRDNAHSHSHSHQASSRPSIEILRPDMSRQNSTSGAYRSMSNTAQSSSSPVWTQPHGGQHQPSRHSVSSTYSTAGVGSHVNDGHNVRSPSSTTAVASARYEEAAIQRQELEAVKRENEALKMRIRELEKSLAGQSQTSTSTVTTNGNVAGAQ